MLPIIITVLVYSLILTVVTFYKDSSSYYVIGPIDIIVSGPICWVMCLILLPIRPLIKNHESKPYSPKSKEYIEKIVSKIIKNYKRHRDYIEYFNFSSRHQYNYNDIDGWDRLLINRSCYEWLNKKFERLMYNQQEDTLAILKSYFKEFTEQDVNDDTPYEVEMSMQYKLMHHNKIYILKRNDLSL